MHAITWGPTGPPPCDVWRAASVVDGADGPWAERLPDVAPIRIRRGPRVVVVSAHLDEELCAAGGLLVRLAAAGPTVDVLEVTGHDGAPHGAVDDTTARELARRRSGQDRRLRLLGLGPVRRSRLALTAPHHGHGETDVVAALSELIGHDPDPGRLICVAPWQHDGHPDHDIVGRAAELVCHAYRVRLVRYLVTAGDRCPDLPWDRVRRLRLPDRVRLAKQSALPRHPGGSACAVATHEVFLV
ncbi:PIG-L family deacetylase [Pseudonocardia sp.]|uniref:PIG-L deacetylase family protein n=1 Tax=Pseudonocardia sp. TaxID=60912 RepID=UPI0026349051|nr:PIG-L family deacetylase [Pseudonocardia sp.]